MPTYRINWQPIIINADGNSNPHRLCQIMAVNKLPEASKVDGTARSVQNIRIRVLTLQQFPHIEHCLEDRAFSGAVGAEEKRDRAEGNTDPRAYPFEVFDSDVRDGHNFSWIRRQFFEG
jgi:hypothetical protein